jgi:hypothetical protein
VADSLGTIYAELRLRLDQFKQDIQTASTDIKSLQTNMSDSMSALSTVGGAMKDVGKSMSKYVTAPIVAAGTASVYMFTQFEEAMSQVKAVGDMTGDQLQSMTDLAMEMGAKTKFSALEAANAMFELTKLGFDANEMMTALPATMDLAAAGGVGLAEASVIVAQSMNMFGEDASQTHRYADVLQKRRLWVLLTLRRWAMPCPMRVLQRRQWATRWKTQRRHWLCSRMQVSTARERVRPSKL